MKHKGLIATASFVAALAFFTVGSFAVPDRSFSENENRPLTSFPAITLGGVTSGEVQKTLTSYFSDQIILRDTAITAKTAMQKLFGKRDIGGVYLCDNGFYIEKITENDLDNSVFEKNLAATAVFLENNAAKFKNESVIIVPPKQQMLAQLLPSGAPVFDAAKRTEKIKATLKGNFIDLGENFNNNNPETLYYKTDHHWTSEGALAAYGEYCKRLSLPAAEVELKTVCDNFRGTLYSKVLDPAAAYDTVTAPADTAAKLTADGKELGGIYNQAALGKKDKYEYFLHGNHALATVSGGNGKGHLLLVKDSYANCAVPMLLNNYESITLVDTRYFTASLTELIKQNDYTDFLMLYSMQGFLTETTLPLINA